MRFPQKQLIAVAITALVTVLTFTSCSNDRPPRLVVTPTTTAHTTTTSTPMSTTTTIDPNVDTLNKALVLDRVRDQQIAAAAAAAPQVVIGTAIHIAAPSGTINCAWNDRACWHGVGQTIGAINGAPCGGTLPSCCTLRFESGGNPVANGSGQWWGLWQFADGTWAGYGGVQHASQASVATQNERAVVVFAGGAGARNWYGDGCYGGR
jgi:hypothetical protein